MSDERGDITQLLYLWRDGNAEAESQLFERVLPELRHLARYLLRGERKGHSLQPTDLVDKAYLRLVNAKNQNWQNRRHFFAIAARAMRRDLIDHARARPDVEFVAFDKIQDFLPATSAKFDLAVTVDRLLNELAKVHPDWCNVVEVKYFLGLTDEEAADALGMSLRTLQRTWHLARRWLFERGDSGDDHNGS